jgi:hypothetical protein
VQDLLWELKEMKCNKSIGSVVQKQIMEEEPEEAAVNKRKSKNNAGGLERHDVL